MKYKITNLKPSQILREAAKRINSGAAYFAWHELANCNVGILAQVILGLNRHQLEKELEKFWCMAVGGWESPESFDEILSSGRANQAWDGTWNNTGRNVQKCHNAKVSVPDLMLAILAKFRYEELADLEYCSDLNIRKSAGLGKLTTNSPTRHETARYFEAFADWLEEKRS